VVVVVVSFIRLLFLCVFSDSGAIMISGAIGQVGSLEQISGDLTRTTVSLLDEYSKGSSVSFPVVRFRLV
jgi:hypothetical protein